MTDRSFLEQLSDVWSAVAALGHDLSPDEWHRPTECPGWDVQDHLSHMVGTEAMLLGRPTPAPAAPAAHVRNAIGEMNEAWVGQRRSRPAAEVLAEFEEVTAARTDALAAMTDEQLATPGPSPIGEVPYATFMSVRVMDCWVHEQDMRQATGRPWRLDGPAAAAALDRLGASFGFVVGKRVAPPEGTVVALRIDGPLARSLAVEIRDGRARPLDPALTPGQGSAEIILPPAVYVRLATGRLAGEDALGSGDVLLDGDRALGEAVVANLSAMP